MRDLITTHSS